MKRWAIKAVLQKGISLLPFRYHVNYFFQKRVTKGLRLSEPFFREKMAFAAMHLQAFSAEGSAVPRRTLELGTGWYPVVPVAFFLAGVDTIYTCDRYAHLSKQQLMETLAVFNCHAEELPLLLPGLRANRLQKLKIWSIPTCH